MSNINVMRKNLGPVTAYKYAVQQGYTGTEQEFAALMASYATVAQDVSAESLVAEGYALGKQNGVDVGNQSPYYHANAKYYAEYAAQSAQTLTIDDTLSEPGQAADAKTTGEIAKNVRKAVSKNILGPAPMTLYPVHVPSGSHLTFSTHDGNPLDNTISIKLYDKDCVQLNAFNFSSGSAKRTVTVNTEGNEYIAFNKPSSSIIQVEFGEEKTEYEPYFSNPNTFNKYSYPNNIIEWSEQISRKGFFEINSKDQMMMGTHDSAGYGDLPNRCHSKDIFIRAHIGDRVIATASPSEISHFVAVAVIDDPIGDTHETYYQSGWKRSLNTVIEHEGYYVFIYNKDVSLFDGSFKVIPSFLGNLEVDSTLTKSGASADSYTVGMMLRTGVFECSDFVSGKRTYANPQSIELTNTRCTTLKVFHLYPGDTITGNNDKPEEHKFVIASSNAYDSGWKDSFFKHTVISEGDYYVNVAKINTNEEIDPSDVSITVTIRDKSSRLYNNRSDEIEGYYNSEMEDTIKKVRESIDSPALVFPVVTDIHLFKASVQTYPQLLQNISYFAKAVKCDFIVNLGDTIEGASEQETSLMQAYEIMKNFANIGLPVFYANGNHDNNPYISNATKKFNINQVYSGFYSSVKGVEYNINENGTDYYIDFDNLGVRLISLNSCNVKVASTYAFGSTTAQWLAQALDTQKTVILVEHLSSIFSQVWNNNSPVNNSGITSVIQTFVNHGGTIIQLNGHSHADFAFVNPWLSIMQVCQKFEKADITTSEYQKIIGYIDEIANPDREAGTYTEDAWSVCIYKPNSNEFDMIRFGAGTDRYFHVTPISPTTLNAKLTGTVTWSTSDSSVATVSDGVVTGVGTGRCAILAKDEARNYECWIVENES